MSSNPSLVRLARAGLIAVVRAADADDALAVAEALIDGGITAIEVTFTVPRAVAVIATLRQRHGTGIALGAGTITRPTQASTAREAGAEFVVSPGYDPDVTRAMRTTGAIAIVGALTPSEVMGAISAGADALKLFPASLAGPRYLTDLRGPFPDTPFIPTGGVLVEHLDQWFGAGAIAVGVGGAVAPRKITGSAHRREVVARARDYAATVRTSIRTHRSGDD